MKKNSTWHNAKDSVPKLEIGEDCEVLAYGTICADTPDRCEGYFLATYFGGYGFLSDGSGTVRYWAELPKPPEHDARGGGEDEEEMDTGNHPA